MYFLEKLCRICVQNGCGLVDINTIDFDSVRLSDKLETCTSLVISKDEVATEICEKCVNKLRVSYHFLDMCKKSTKIIQGYLTKLTAQENNSNFKNCDLTVDLPTRDFDEEITETRQAIAKRKQRITKEQRCSLLKQLLNRPKKDRDKSYFSQNKNYDYDKGGLKNIIDFTKNYEFSFNLDKNCNIESTPLDKLTAFSTDYFTRDFSDFKNHVLYVIENRHEFEYFDEFSDNEETYVTVEPDIIKIKSEIMDSSSEEDQCPLDYLETSIEVKQERLSPEPVSINSSVKLLDRLVSSYPPIGARKVFSHSNVRCRTREQPYINPMLKNQFLYRSFRCERCNRYFKSQGYLKAHNSKVH